MDWFPAVLGTLVLLCGGGMVAMGLASRLELRRLAAGARVIADETFAQLDTRLAVSEAETRRLRQRLAELESRVGDDDRTIAEEVASLSPIPRGAG
jgi:hypothetical protein